MDSPLPVSKKEVALQLLRQGGLLVHLDPRGDDVLVPFRFKHLTALTLPIGIRPDLPKDDLRVDDEGISSTLRFRRMAWRCRLPWRSVFALGDPSGQGSVWPSDIPEETRPEDDLQPGPVAIPAPLTAYLVINGRAVVGDGMSVFSADGEPVPGVRWIDYGGTKLRMGGRLEEIERRFSPQLSAKGSSHQVPFSMFLAYTTGKQNCEVNWDGCTIRMKGDGFIDIRARECQELRAGWGAGPGPYIREWITRLGGLFSRG